MTFVQRIHGPACGCDDTQALAGLISLDTALQRIASRVEAVRDTEVLPISEAMGRILSAPVQAQTDMPRFDHAAMDGYALSGLSFEGQGPWRIPLGPRYAAGDEAGEALPFGTAARILTGAPLPEGADCVVPQENVTRDDDGIILNEPPKHLSNIRLRGEERSAGAVLLPKGTRLTERSIAAAASGGVGKVTVRRRLRVALLVSGAELASAGSEGVLGSGQIWDINTPMLRAALSRQELDLVMVRSVPDTLSETRDALHEASQAADLVVTTGGVSVGDEDHLRSAVRTLRGTLHFAGVAIKPGKPLAFGRIGRTCWLGLPGNPLAAFVTWRVFGTAIVAAMTGATDQPQRRNVVLARSVSRRPGRCEIRPARHVGFDGAGRDVVSCDRTLSSGQVASLATADGLAFFAADTEHLPEGALVEFLPFDTV